MGVNTGINEEGERVSTNVITTIAAHEEVDPMELHPPLIEAIDLEALDMLFSGQMSPRESGMVDLRFQYHGYEIRIASDGGVKIDGSEEP